MASEDFHPIPSIIGITTEEYCWIIPSVGPTPKPPGAREPIGGVGGGGFHGSRPILPPARFSLTTQSVSNSDTQAGWTETVKDVLQETSAVMAPRDLTPWGGAPLLSQGMGDPSHRYPNHAASPRFPNPSWDPSSNPVPAASLPCQPDYPYSS